MIKKVNEVLKVDTGAVNKTLETSDSTSKGSVIKTGSKVAAGAGIVSLIPAAVGFSTAGPVAGTIAAVWQGYIGNVVAGSIFSGL